MEYMVCGYCKDQFFREFFSHKESAIEFARQYKIWHKADDWCRVYEVKKEEITI